MAIQKMGNDGRILFAWSELVKSRGWTDGLIRKYLGEADELRENPHYKSGPPMRLFNIVRVEEVEDYPEVASDLARAKARRPALSSAASAAAKLRKNELLQEVDSIVIDVPRYDYDQVCQNAINSYNQIWMRRSEDKYASIDSDPSFLARITANYVRHELVDYDRIVSALKGRIGKNEAYELFKLRVMEKIYQVYPEIGSHP